MKLYSIYDVKAETYAPPFVAHNDAVATRMVLEACRNTRMSLSEYPADYQLRIVADWSDDTGVIANDNYPYVLSTVEAILTADRATRTSSESDNV